MLDDNFGGGYQLVEYLVSQGHSRIAGIFKSDDIQGIERYSGYIHALRDHGKLKESSTPVAWFTTENRVRMMDSHLVDYIKGLYRRRLLQRRGGVHSHLTAEKCRCPGSSGHGGSEL